ncbi:MAG: ketopantoate reductase family protein [bacterium]
MINKNFKIAIIGPGSMGCLFAGFLTKSGFTVWLIDKKSERVEKIKKNGIYIKDFKQNFKIKVNITTSIQEIGTCDLIIICVKSYDTKSALEKIKKLIKNDTLILTLQNGIGNIEIIKQFISNEKIITGITYEASTCLGNGKIKHTGSGETIISKPQKEIISIFKKSGFKIKTSQNIDSIIWSKLVINAAINPLATITKLHNGELLKYKETQNILEQVIIETTKISSKKKYKITL